MANGLDLGNILFQAERIKGARQQFDANALLQQRAAQFNPLVQQHLQQGSRATGNALIQADPAAATDIFQARGAQTTARQQQFDLSQDEADQTLRGAQAVMKSKAPKALLLNAFPDFVEQLQQQGVDVNKLTDEQVVQVASGIVEQVSPFASPEFLAKRGGLGTQRGRDVADLQARGFNLSDAQDIAAGRIRVRENLITGEPELVNLATGEVRPAGQGQPPPPSGPPSPAPQEAPGPVLTGDKRKLLLDENAEINRAKGLISGLDPVIRSGTGPGASAAEVIDKFAAFIGSRAFPETVENRNKVRFLSKELQKALINNPKFPVAEQEFVRKLLPNADTFFTNPGAEVDKLRTLAQFLDTQEAANIAQLAGRQAPPAQFGESVRQQTATNAQGQKVFFNEQTRQWEPL